MDIIRDLVIQWKSQFVEQPRFTLYVNESTAICVLFTDCTFSKTTVQTKFCLNLSLIFINVVSPRNRQKEGLSDNPRIIAVNKTALSIRTWYLTEELMSST